MNKRCLISWAIFFPILFMLVFFVIQTRIPIAVRTFLVVIMLVLIFLWPYYLVFAFMFICSPKEKLPRKVNLCTYINDVLCNQITRSEFDILFYNKTIRINMGGWIFKKHYIRDIVLMYYHLYYYNYHKLKSFKNLSKKFFPAKNLSILFMMKNGKKKELYLIKNGKERRTILCDIKLLFLTGRISRRKNTKDEYYKMEVPDYYLSI